MNDLEPFFYDFSKQLKIFVEHLILACCIVIIFKINMRSNFSLFFAKVDINVCIIIIYEIYRTCALKKWVMIFGMVAGHK